MDKTALMKTLALVVDAVGFVKGTGQSCQVFLGEQFNTQDLHHHAYKLGSYQPWIHRVRLVQPSNPANVFLTSDFILENDELQSIQDSSTQKYVFQDNGFYLDMAIPDHPPS